MIIMPTRNHLGRAIQLTEATLAREEQTLDGPRERSCQQARKLLADWPTTVDFQDSRWPLYKYELYFFLQDAEQWNESMPMLLHLACTTRRSQKASPCVPSPSIEDNKWPTEFEDEYPERELPMVTLYSLSQTAHRVRRQVSRARAPDG